jgi:hypothetical protein
MATIWSLIALELNGGERPSFGESQIDAGAGMVEFGYSHVDDGDTIYPKPLDCRASESDNEHWTGFAGFTR